MFYSNGRWKTVHKFTIWDLVQIFLFTPVSGIIDFGNRLSIHPVKTELNRNWTYSGVTFANTVLKIVLQVTHESWNGNIVPGILVERRVRPHAGRHHFRPNISVFLYTIHKRTEFFYRVWSNHSAQRCLKKYQFFIKKKK